MTGRDQGNVTVLICAVMAVIGVVTALGLVLGGAVIAHHRAAAAADLGALAGAAQLVRGSSAAEACKVAEHMLLANGARLETCAVAGATLDLRAAVTAPRGLPDAQAAARAGPDTEAPIDPPP